MNPAEVMHAAGAGEGNLVNLNLNNLLTIIACLAGFFGLAGAWFVLPYRVKCLENKLNEELKQMRLDHDTLTEIKTNQLHNATRLDGIQSTLTTLLAKSP